MYVLIASLICFLMGIALNQLRLNQLMLEDDPLFRPAKKKIVWITIELFILVIILMILIFLSDIKNWMFEIPIVAGGCLLNRLLFEVKYGGGESKVTIGKYATGLVVTSFISLVLYFVKF